jgi:hypothetical protein
VKGQMGKQILIIRPHYYYYKEKCKLCQFIFLVSVWRDLVPYGGLHFYLVCLAMKLCLGNDLSGGYSPLFYFFIPLGGGKGDNIAYPAG